MNDATRRDFLKAAAACLASASAGSTVLAAQQEGPAGLPVRPLGKTGQQVPIVGLGGWHIGSVKEDREAIAIMHEAIDSGMTFFDNCWDYHQGRSEELMGRALASGGRREKVFLMTKVCGRDYPSAMRHLDDSLRRLKTDRLDLWQFHGMKWDDDADLIFAEKNGAYRAALEARRAGKVRYIGFTGHKDPKFHQAMLDKPFDWDTAQMPINALDPHYHSFIKNILPQCVKRQIGVVGMKGLSTGLLPAKLGFSAEVSRRYALSLPISVLVCGITSRKDLRQDVAIARGFRPMTEADVTGLLAKTRPLGTDGGSQPYKTGNYGCDWYHKQRA